MSALSFAAPELGRPDKTEDPKIVNALTAIETWANGNIDYSNMNTGANQLFVKMVAPGSKKMNWGEFVPSTGFDGEAGRSRWEGVVPHGLGVIPAVAFVTAKPIAVQEDGGVHKFAVTASVLSVDVTNLTVVMTAPGTTNNGTNLYWLAIG